MIGKNKMRDIDRIWTKEARRRWQAYKSGYGDKLLASLADEPEKLNISACGKRQRYQYLRLRKAQGYRQLTEINRFSDPFIKNRCQTC